MVVDMNFSTRSCVKCVFTSVCVGALAMWPYQIVNAGTLSASTPPLAIQTQVRPVRNSDVGGISGTAFFVSNNGEALTNAHVVENCQQIRVSGAPAKLLARDTTNDLALLATDLHPTQWARWRQSVRLGEDVVVYGFPLAGVLSSGGNVVTGNVTALAGLGDDSRYLQISAPVQPGNSGGPLLDKQV